MLKKDKGVQRLLNTYVNLFDVSAQNTFVFRMLHFVKCTQRMNYFGDICPT